MKKIITFLFCLGLSSCYTFPTQLQISPEPKKDGGTWVGLTTLRLFGLLGASTEIVYCKVNEMPDIIRPVCYGADLESMKKYHEGFPLKPQK